MEELMGDWVGRLASQLGSAEVGPSTLPGSDGREWPPTLVGAVSGALADLDANGSGVPMADVLVPGSSASSVEVNALIDGLDPDAVGQQTLLALDRGIGVVKIKVGARPWHQDLARVQAACTAMATSAASCDEAIGRVRLDANGGWDVAEARRALAECDELGIELVEDPVADPVAAAQIGKEFATPVAVDAPVTSLYAAQHLVGLDGVDVLVIKPAVCGGPHAAVGIAEVAVEAGRDWFVTSFIDTGVGRMTAVHAAIAGGSLGGRLACGLATGHLMAPDVAGASLGVPIDGHISVSAAPGHGVTPDRDSLELIASWESP